MSTVATTAADVLEKRVGVCRDFTHLAMTFCRALDIPTRYVFGYIPAIDVPPPDSPMDFCAWFEAYLGGGWWTFDPRNNQRRKGRVTIARGRDAADVAMVTTYGPSTLQTMEVWADDVTPQDMRRHSGASHQVVEQREFDTLDETPASRRRPRSSAKSASSTAT